MTPRSPSVRRSRLGAVLLEVVFALVLLVAGGGIVIGGLNIATDEVLDLRRRNTARDRAVTILSEMQMGVIGLADTEPEGFEEPFEEWTWQVVLSDFQDVIDVPQTVRATVVIRHEPSGRVHRLVHLFPASAGGDAGFAGRGFGGEGRP
jgi:hypothetical protein